MDLAATPPARVPTRIVLTSVVGVWVCYFVLATARGWLVGLEMHDALLVRRIAVTVVSMGVTTALWPLLRLLDPRPVWQQSLAVLLIALPASVLLAQINQWTFADIEDQVQAKIGAREGLLIRSDEAGNLLVDPLNSPAAQPTDVAAPPPVVPSPQPVIPTIAQQEQQSAAITIPAQTRDDNRWRQLTDLTISRYFLLIAWAALYFGLVNAEQSRAAERREGEYRRAAKAAELRSLRYQVNPHFLFNTLNSLSALVMTGKRDAAETMIQTLSTFYRRSLADDPTGDVILEDEIALQRLYLQLEAVRFPDRLKVEFDVPAALAEARLPGMILQPLVENSVKYGVATTRRAVTVTIAAEEEYGRLVLTVADDGPGYSNKAGSGTGIGLANVRDRLATRFGDAADLVSGPADGGGWRTVIRLPLIRHD